MQNIKVLWKVCKLGYENQIKIAMKGFDVLHGTQETKMIRKPFCKIGLLTTVVGRNFGYKATKVHFWKLEQNLAEGEIEVSLRGMIIIWLLGL